MRLLIDKYILDLDSAVLKFQNFLFRLFKIIFGVFR